MSSKGKRLSPKTGAAEVVKGFDAEKLSAPFVLRCGALMIDYILVLLIPVLSLLLGRFLQYDGAKLLNSEVNNTGWLITILLCVTNFIIFPIFSGQTIGKMLTGLRIVKMDGSAPGVGTILSRHLFGYPLTLFSAMIGFLLALANKNGRALHDYVASTMVVYGSQKRKVKTTVRKRKKQKVKKAKAGESLA